MAMTATAEQTGGGNGGGGSGSGRGGGGGEPVDGTTEEEVPAGTQAAELNPVEPTATVPQEEADGERLTVLRQLEITGAPALYDPTPVLRGHAAPEIRETSAHESLQLQPQAATDDTRQQRFVVVEKEHEAAALVPTQSVPTCAFTTKVRDTWSLMFGARFDDDDDHGSEQRDETRDMATTTTTKSSSSLRHKLDHERRLDQQIQRGNAHRPRVRPRPSGQPHTSRRSAVTLASPSSSSPPNAPRQEPWRAEDRPLEGAGLAPTTVRFCLENAMRATVVCLAQLHAIAQDEPEPPRAELELGVFLTQWELDAILYDLFGNTNTQQQQPPCSSSSARLTLHNTEYESLPLGTLLQVSWFLPLDQFQRQRSLVAQIARTHLSERKLAVLNAALHRHFVLRPHPGVKMQRLLLRVVASLTKIAEAEPVAAASRSSSSSPSSNQRNESHDSSEPLHGTTALVVELLQAMHIRIPPQVEPLSILQFMRLAPNALVTWFQLTSVVAVQRIVFFRLFIESLASEFQTASPWRDGKSWWPGKSSATSSSGRQVQPQRQTHDAAPTPLRSVARRRRKAKPRTTPLERNDDNSRPHHNDLQTTATTTAQDGDAARVPSTLASHGSTTSLFHGDDDHETTSNRDGDTAAHHSKFTTLQRQLTAALTKLERAHPWLVEEEADAAAAPSSTATAIRVSFLAAGAFQQSLVLLGSTGETPMAVSLSVLQKIQEFTDSINQLIDSRTVVEATPPPDSAAPEPEDPAPSRPLLARVQRGDTCSSLFPPPYIATTPSYWTFDPALPLAPSTPTGSMADRCNGSIPRSVAKPRPPTSPGVGEYDVARSDKLTFQQRRGFTFSKSGLEPVDEDASTKTKTKTPTKPTAASSSATPRHRKHSNNSGIDAKDPPAYTHWAAAATNTDREAWTERLLHHHLVEEIDDNEEEDVETRVQEALRLQQSFVLDDMVQNLLHRGRSVAAASSLFSIHHRDTPSRVVSRVRSATANAKPNPQPQRRQPPAYSRTTSTTSTTTPRPSASVSREVKLPPQDCEPPADDAHLRWAARVSEFYKSKRHATTAATLTDR